MEGRVMEGLGMEPLIRDLASYVKRDGGRNVTDIFGMYVNNCLNSGSKSFGKDTEVTLCKFDSKPRLYDKFKFFGLQITTILPGQIFVMQSDNTTNWTIIPIDSTFSKFWKQRTLFSWLLSTRPELSCFANQASQVTENLLSKEKMTELKKMSSGPETASNPV